MERAGQREVLRSCTGHPGGPGPGRRGTVAAARRHELLTQIDALQRELRELDADTPAAPAAQPVAAAQGREDRRTVAGARYQQSFGATDWRVQGVYDVKDIDQTFGTIGDNVNPNWQFATDLSHRGPLFGLDARHYAGFFFNHMEQESTSFRNLADFQGTRGALDSQTRGHHQNLGGRLREEVDLGEHWTGVLGIGAEHSTVVGKLRRRTAAETFSIVDVDRDFLNVAPEAALIYRPDEGWEVHARVGSGYGIPGIGQLTTTSAGVAGNNTDLATQKNIGADLGVDFHPHARLAASLTGYYEIFFEEFVTQSPGAGLSSFTANAPRAEHRGIGAFLQVDNLFDRDYIASANVVADAPTDTAATLLDKQAFFAGQERSIYGGVKLKF